MRAVVGRVDRIEADLAKLSGTVTGLGNVVKSLLAQKQEQAKQPDWLSVDKPAVAEAMLLATAEWTDRYGATLGLRPQPCWPWHPHLVAVLLAAAQHHAAVYRGPEPDRGHRLPHPLPARPSPSSCATRRAAAARPSTSTAARSTSSTATNCPTSPAGGPPTAPASPPASPRPARPPPEQHAGVPS